MMHEKKEMPAGLSKSINAPLKKSGGRNVMPVSIPTGESWCLYDVPPAPKRIIGQCSYYYRPHPDDYVIKTGLKAKDVISFALGLRTMPVEAVDLFWKLYTNYNKSFKQALAASPEEDVNWSRWHDFKKRHVNCKHEPPEYYISYGYYYCSNYTKFLSPKFKTAKAKVWLIEARRLLHIYMEAGLKDNKKATVLSTPSLRYPEKPVKSVYADVDRIEVSQIFKKFAFNSHVAAYLDAGMLQIPLANAGAGKWEAAKHNLAGLTDLINLGTEPDIQEFCDPDTWDQIWQIAKEMIPGIGHKRQY